MATYVSLTALDGSPVEVNPDQVTSITPVPPDLLPVGVSDGSYVELTGDDRSQPRVAVQGTVADTVSALGGAGGFGFVTVSGAGAIQASRQVTSVTRTGVGLYDIVWAFNSAGGTVSTSQGASPSPVAAATYNPTGATTAEVQIFDNTLALADLDWYCIAFPTS